MGNKKMVFAAGFFLFLIGIVIWDLAIVMPPIWATNGQMELAEPFYFAFSFACHQLDTRSLCIYQQDRIGDCAGAVEGERNIFVGACHGGDCLQQDVGVKFPVCSRDIAIYFTILMGGIVWGILNRFNLSSDKWPHPKWLILAIIPIALDGGTQLIGLRESTNQLRMITGSIVGFACAFYLIPLMNQIFNPIFEDIVLFLKKKK